jgi:hypothetical protein
LPNTLAPRLLEAGRFLLEVKKMITLQLTREQAEFLSIAIASIKPSSKTNAISGAFGKMSDMIRAAIDETQTEERPAALEAISQIELEADFYGLRDKFTWYVTIGKEYFVSNTLWDLYQDFKKRGVTNYPPGLFAFAELGEGTAQFDTPGAGRVVIRVNRMKRDEAD